MFTSLFFVSYFRAPGGGVPTRWDNGLPAATGGLSVERVSDHFEETKSKKAAKWLVTQGYPKSEWRLMRTSQRRVFEEALLTLPNLSDEDAQLKAAYAEFIKAKRGEQYALPFLIAASDRIPMLGLHAAKILRESGEEDRANELGHKALQAIKKSRAEEPENAQHIVDQATAMIFLEQKTEALVTLIKASQNTDSEDDKTRLNYAIGDAIVVWIVGMDEVEIDPANPAADPRNNVWKMLGSAVDAAPNNLQVLSEVRKQLMLIKEKNEDEFRRDKELLFGGTQPGYYELIRGVAALINKQERIAGQNLVRSIELAPKNTLLLKNLAVAFAFSYRGVLDSKDTLELGLKLANLAIKKTPDPTPDFFEARGQILVRLERYEEAIPDLEKASQDPGLEAAMKELVQKCRDYLDQ